MVLPVVVPSSRRRPVLSSPVLFLSCQARLCLQRPVPGLGCCLIQERDPAWDGRGVQIQIWISCRERRPTLGAVVRANHAGRRVNEAPPRTPEKPYAYDNRRSTGSFMIQYPQPLKSWIAAASTTTPAQPSRRRQWDGRCTGVLLDNCPRLRLIGPRPGHADGSASAADYRTA